jgi:hypothetical protein
MVLIKAGRALIRPSPGQPPVCLSRLHARPAVLPELRRSPAPPRGRGFSCRARVPPCLPAHGADLPAPNTPMIAGRRLQPRPVCWPGQPPHPPERLTSLRWRAPNAGNSIEGTFNRGSYGRHHRKHEEAAMPGQRSAQYTPRTARAIQWLGAFTLFQAIGIAGLALVG